MIYRRENTEMRIIDEMGAKAKAASRTLAVAGEKKNDALKAIAKALIENQDKIIEANKKDLENGEKNGLSAALIDRLRLDEGRIKGVADGVLEVAALPDPIGTVISGSTRPNGMEIRRVRVPLGVIGIIFESRPNVTRKRLHTQGRKGSNKFKQVPCIHNAGGY